MQPAEGVVNGLIAAPPDTTTTARGVDVTHGLDQQHQGEQEEQDGSTDPYGPLRQPGAEHATDPDGESVGGHHAERRTQPGTEHALAGGERDGGQHGLVAQLGQEEHRADGEDDVPRRLRRPFGVLVGELVAAQRPDAEDRRRR